MISAKHDKFDEKAAMNSRRLNLKSEDAKVRPALAQLTPCSSDNEAFNPIFQMQSPNP